MKKFLMLSIICLFSVPSFGADDLMYTNDMWDNYSQTINEGQEAKPITDEEFEKAIEQIDAKVNKWKNWAEKLKRPKGKEFSQSNETEILNNEHGEDASLPVISLPVEVQIADGYIPIGHYQVKGEMVDSKPVLSFYQAHNLFAKIPATETNSDFGKDEILFADWISENDKQIKIIYGSLDFNAYAIVDILAQ